MRTLLILWILAFSLLGCGDKASTSSTSYWIKQSGERPKTVVVFIHGVLGDSRTTWASEEGKPGWPEIVLSDPLMPRSDVLAVGFRSGPVQEASNIEEVAVRTLGFIEDEGVFKDYDNVVFVVHSLGGLVTKRALRILQAKHPEDLQRVKAVLFFSTPAQGSDLAAMAQWLSSNPQFENMKPADFNAFLQVLDNDWQSLRRARTAEMPFPRVFCAYETLSTATFKIVPRSGAESACDNTPIAFDRDHISIVKPVSADDELHKYLRKRIVESLDPMLLQQNVSVKFVKSNNQLLEDGGSLRSGEQYAIELAARRPAWFYVFGVDSSGQVDRYFPHSMAAAEQTPPNTSIRIPEDPKKYLTLDSTTGIERVYIFALDKPDSSLASEGAAVGDQAREKLDTTLKVFRGAYVAPRKPDSSGETQLSITGLSATDVLMFEHKP